MNFDLEIKGKTITFNCGDFVECHSLKGQLPYVGCIVEINATQVKVQWMFRPEDLPSHLLPSFCEKNEVFYCDTWDYNEISVIRRKISIKLSIFSPGQSTYLCRMEYLPSEDKIVLLSQKRLDSISTAGQVRVDDLELKMDVCCGLEMLELIAF